MLLEPEKFCPQSASLEPAIVLIDSGIGALGLVPDMRKLNPMSFIVVIADQQGFPYGAKTEQEVLARIDHLATFANAYFNIQTIIVACNTASTLVLPHLRNKYKFPIVGVVPAIKPAAQETKTKVIALLATQATVNRPYTDDLIKQFAQCYSY
jgi:glutamate racemase